jgi:hypothetical protein
MPNLKYAALSAVALTITCEVTAVEATTQIDE